MNLFKGGMAVFSVMLLICVLIESTQASGVRSRRQPADPTASPQVQNPAPNSSTTLVRILVQPKNTVAEADLQSTFAAVGVQQEDVIHQIDVRLLSIPAAQRDNILNALSHHPHVEFAEPDAVVSPEFVPNDPFYPNQWHVQKIQCPNAWDSTTGSSSVIIAILDTGVDGNHPDLAPNLVAGWNFYDNNSNTSDVIGHGTAVAGTAAAAGNNGLGLVGVAFNCRIMPLRVGDASTGSATLSTIANALTYAADHGARVANISYKATDSSTISSAAQYFQSKGGVTTVSAGNDGTFDATADNPYILTVSATDSNDVLASWSSTGNNTDLSAPGVLIYTTTSGGGYGGWSGTSFSAPIVAGAAALVISANPTLSGSQVQDILKKNADDLGAAGWDPSYGYGRVNAYKAVLAALGSPAADTTPPTAVVTSPANGVTVSGTTSVTVGASDNVGVTKVELYINGSLAGSSPSATSTFSWDTTTGPNGSCTLQSKAYDAAGNSGSSAILTLNVSNAPAPDTTAPTVQINSPVNGSTLSGTLSVTLNASDNVGVTRVELYLNGSLFGSSTSSNPSFSWDTTTVSNGSYTLQAKAYDAAGNVGVSAMTNVSVNNPPPVSQTTDITPPTAQIISPTNGSAVSKTVKISVKTSDNVGVVKVDLYIDGKFYNTSSSSSPTFNWNTSKVAKGQHTLRGIAYDAANNPGASPIVTVTK